MNRRTHERIRTEWMMERKSNEHHGICGQYTYLYTETGRERDTDRQTTRQTDRQCQWDRDRQTDRQTDSRDPTPQKLTHKNAYNRTRVMRTPLEPQLWCKNVSFTSDLCVTFRYQYLIVPGKTLCLISVFVWYVLNTLWYWLGIKPMHGNISLFFFKKENCPRRSCSTRLNSIETSW